MVWAPNLRKIGQDGMSKCNSLFKIIAPLEEIHDTAFSCCFALSWINLKNLKILKKHSFEFCDSL